VPGRCGACLNCALNDEALIVIIVGAMRGLGGFRRCGGVRSCTDVSQQLRSRGASRAGGTAGSERLHVLRGDPVRA
jgi:hypothetical protein